MDGRKKESKVGRKQGMNERRKGGRKNERGKCGKYNIRDEEKLVM